MSGQVWATYAVNDHLVEHPWVRDLMLFDRLVIPVPNMADDKEWGRWEVEGWDPDGQERLLDLIGKRAVRVPWDSWHQSRWESRYRAGLEVANDVSGWAFQATRTQLSAEVPANVRAVAALTAYPSLEALERDVGLRRAGQINLPNGAIAAILGRELLVPDGYENDDDLLKAALELSGDRDFQRRRAAFWRWQRQFTRDDLITDQSAVKEALEEMADLISDEKRTIAKQRIKTQVSSVIMLCSVAVALGGAPALVPLAAAGAFLSIGQWAVDHLPEPDKNYGGASLFGDARQHFGWL